MYVGKRERERGGGERASDRERYSETQREGEDERERGKDTGEIREDTQKRQPIAGWIEMCLHNGAATYKRM